MSKRRKHYLQHPVQFISEELWDSCVEPEDNSPGLGGHRHETNGREPMLGGERRAFVADGDCSAIVIPFDYGSQSRRAALVKTLRELGYRVLELNRPETIVARALKQIPTTPEPRLPPSLAHLIAIDDPMERRR